MRITSRPYTTSAIFVHPCQNTLALPDRELNRRHLENWNSVNEARIVSQAVSRNQRLQTPSWSAKY
jgi:hypothetical protein